jgi:hypothetical protein
MIGEKANVSSGWVGSHVGQVDPVKRAACEARSGAASLLTLGFVRVKLLDIDGKKERAYGITASGRKALEKAEAAE